MTMTPAQAAHRKNLLKVIHTARRALTMQEDDYRALLARTVGKNSAADCTLPELKGVIDALRRLGFVPKRGHAARPRVAPENRIILDKIGAILADKQLRARHGQENVQARACRMAASAGAVQTDAGTGRLSTAGGRPWQYLTQANIRTSLTCCRAVCWR